MKKSALDYLVCNECWGPLQLQADEMFNESAEPEVITGVLTCLACGKTFPIMRGVPRFVDQRSTLQNLETGQRFGVAWKEFPRLDARYKDQFFDWLRPVRPAFLENKIVLEAGCGKGRHAHLIMDAGAKHVFAVDIGEAVDVAFQNVGTMPGVHIIQSDICSMPFKDCFDFAFSVGVLHHMDEPESGFRSMVRCLKPDGAVCIWVYGRENNWWLIHIINPFRIGITARMAAGPLRFVALMMAIPVYVISKWIAKPYMDLRKQLRFLPIMFYGDYLSYIARFDFNEIHHIVFDHLVAPVSNYIPREEVRKWFENSGMEGPVIRWHNRNSWSSFASRDPEDYRRITANE